MTDNVTAAYLGRRVLVFEPTSFLLLFGRFMPVRSEDLSGRGMSHLIRVKGWSKPPRWTGRD